MNAFTVLRHVLRLPTSIQSCATTFSCAADAEADDFWMPFKSLKRKQDAPVLVNLYLMSGMYAGSLEVKASKTKRSTYFHQQSSLASKYPMPVLVVHLPDDRRRTVRAGQQPFPHGAIDLDRRSIASGPLRNSLPVFEELIRTVRTIDLGGVGICTTQVWPMPLHAH